MDQLSATWNQKLEKEARDSDTRERIARERGAQAARAVVPPAPIAPPGTADTRYSPTNTRREARKLKTLATYKSWRKEYRALKKSRPDMSDVWYSQQLAGMEIGKGKSPDTIRKHLKS